MSASELIWAGFRSMLLRTARCPGRGRRSGVGGELAVYCRIQPARPSPLPMPIQSDAGHQLQPIGEHNPRRVRQLGRVVLEFLHPPTPPLRPQLAIYLPQKFFQNFDKAGRLINSLDLSPSHPRLDQSSTLWITDTSVIPWLCFGQFANLGTERGSCGSTDKLARTSIMRWLE